LPASKDGGRLDQLVLYRDAPASDFLAAKKLEAEKCPFTWRSALWKGYFRWCAKMVFMLVIISSSQRVCSTTRGIICCGSTAGEEARVGTPSAGEDGSGHLAWVGWHRVWQLCAN
jgi:hypothetical protein